MTVRIVEGDSRVLLAGLSDESVQCCVTSPPYYGLRDYGAAGQIGVEPTLTEYLDRLVQVFREVRRVLRRDGVLWLNIGDSYNAAGRIGHGTRVGRKQGTNRASAKGADRCRPNVTELKEKDLIGVPWRIALALQADGWYLRSDVVWAKPNPMPEGVVDRPTKSHEYVFLLTKSARYFYDAEAVAEPTVDGNTKRNLRDVWTIAPAPVKSAHFATFPPRLAELCVLSGSAPGDTVLDPFGGAGTTGLAADRLGRDAILLEINPEFVAMAGRRIGPDRLSGRDGISSALARNRQARESLSAALVGGL